MARQLAITPDTYKRFLIDSGAVYLNYGEAGEALFGATRGGSVFAIPSEYRDMPADGARGKVVGSRRITNVEAKLTVSMLELSYDTINKALPGSSVSDQSTYWEITRALQIAASDYLTNVAIVGEWTGNDTVPFVGIIKNALADGGFEISMVDKDESVLSIEFSAHFDASDLDTEPWEIRWPKQTA